MELSAKISYTLPQFTQSSRDRLELFVAGYQSYLNVVSTTQTTAKEARQKASALVKARSDILTHLQVIASDCL